VAIGSSTALKQKAQNYNNDGYFTAYFNLAFVLSNQSKYDCNSYQ